VTDPDRPDDDASADEIATQLEQDFGRVVGVETASEEDGREVVEVEILDRQT